MRTNPAMQPIQLESDEALVLFEFASRFTETDHLSIADPAERAVLWNLCAALERVLVAPLKPDYDALLQEARRRVREEAGV